MNTIAEETPSTVPASGKTVLVIEDDRDINDLLCSIVKTAGHEPKSALNGKNGLDIIRNEPPDLLILDIMLPDIDGITIKKEMSASEDLKNIPVIVVSAKTDINSKLMSFLSGARRYITKPFTFDEALLEIQAVFRQQDISRNIREYRDECLPDGDFGSFPTDIRAASEECREKKKDKQG